MNPDNPILPPPGTILPAPLLFNHLPVDKYNISSKGLDAEEAGNVRTPIVNHIKVRGYDRKKLTRMSYGMMPRMR